MPLARLVHVQTADSVRLDGVLEWLEALPEHPLPYDAALLVHGTGANFYGSALLERLAERLVAAGVAAVRINTRGHDLMSTAHGVVGPRRAGAAYERVDECRYDLAAWIDWAHGQGFSRLLLVGHSLGALKSIYTLCQAEPRPVLGAVERLVAISPPRLSYRRFAASARAEEFLADFAAAEAHVREGRAEQLIAIRFPMPYLVSAAGYVDKYGPDERYNILSLLDRLPCPALFTYGDQELRGNPAFEGLAAEVEAHDPARRRIRVDVLAGADHFYAGAQAELWGRLQRWLRS